MENQLKKREWKALEVSKGVFKPEDDKFKDVASWVERHCASHTGFEEELLADIATFKKNIENPNKTTVIKWQNYFAIAATIISIIALFFSLLSYFEVKL